MQPIPKLGEVVNMHGPVEPDEDNIRQEPYTLPQGFTWDTLDQGDHGVLKELYILLNENYVEDDDNVFRFFSRISSVGSLAAWLAPPVALWGFSGLRSETGWIHHRHPSKHPYL